MKRTRTNSLATPEEQEFLVRVGATIRRRRESLGIDQRELAKTLGVRPSAVCHWEKGNAGVLISRLVRIAKALSTTPAELLA